MGRFALVNAGIAQLVEQLICNQQVVGSNPTAGSLVNRDFRGPKKVLLGHFLDTFALPARHSADKRPRLRIAKSSLSKHRSPFQIEKFLRGENRFLLLVPN